MCLNLNNLINEYTLDIPFWLAIEESKIKIFNHLITLETFDLKYSLHTNYVEYRLYNKNIVIFLKLIYDVYVEITHINIKQSPDIIIKNNDEIHMRIEQKYIDDFDPILLYTNYLALYTNQKFLIIDEKLDTYIHAKYDKDLDLFVTTFN